MCDKAVSNDPFILKYCHNRYETYGMCNKVVDDFLPELKLVPDWFVTSKMIEKIHTALFVHDGKLFFDENSVNVTFSTDEMGILSIDHNNFNLDDVIFDEDDPKTIIHVKLKQSKHLKKI